MAPPEERGACLNRAWLQSHRGPGPRGLRSTEDPYRSGSLSRASSETMLKHILVPVDGSSQSDLALRTALSLAQCLGSRVTVFYALPSEQAYAYATVPPFVDRAQLRNRTLHDIHTLISEQAPHYLRELVASHQKSNAAPLSVAIDWKCTESDHPYRAIIDTAHQLGCDLIVMASHGRRGMDAVLLGSETHKLLTHSDLPVLVVPPMSESQTKS